MSSQKDCADQKDKDMDVWAHMQVLAQALIKQNPIFKLRLSNTLLGLSPKEICANLFVDFASSSQLDKTPLYDLAIKAIENDPRILICVEKDLEAFVDRDPSTANCLQAFLYRKGFHALLIYRIAHFYWHNHEKELALFISSVCSRTLAVDIHPAAKLDEGLMLDHATGIVIGETAVVGKNVSILHNVTLGGTGKESGDRHPKIREGVLLGAGATILGNIEIGQCSKVAAGSVVLENVPSHTTVAGVPAKVVKHHLSPTEPSISMDQMF